VALIHNDYKFDNVMLDPNCRARLGNGDCRRPVDEILEPPRGYSISADANEQFLSMSSIRVSWWRVLRVRNLSEVTSRQAVDGYEFLDKASNI